MKHKVTRLILDFEEEEKWLNEMSAKGFQFIGYGFPTYLFEDGRPGEYTYRIELLEHSPSNIESRQYIKFLEDTGAECVDTFYRWAYFRKKTADGPFDLYTDLDSRIKHYQRILRLLQLLIVCEVGIGLFVLNVSGSIPLVALIMIVIIMLVSKLKKNKSRIEKLKAEAAIHE